MRVWRHKETKKIVRSTPWWEIPEGILDDETVTAAMKAKGDPWPERKYKIGALVQVGWLLENEHGVWWGVGPKAIDSFEDLGVWKP